MDAPLMVEVDSRGCGWFWSGIGLVWFCTESKSCFVDLVLLGSTILQVFSSQFSDKITGFPKKFQKTMRWEKTRWVHIFLYKSSKNWLRGYALDFVKGNFKNAIWNLGCIPMNSIQKNANFIRNYVIFMHIHTHGCKSLTIPAIPYKINHLDIQNCERGRSRPTYCKLGTFLIMPLTLTEPIFNNFQENGLLGVINYP